MNILSKTAAPNLGASHSPAGASAEQFAETQIQAFELRQKALGRLTADVHWLTGRPCNSIRWMSTRRDLVEMIDLAWMQRTLTDRQGRPYSRRQLARRVFAVVGQSMPHSLERVVSQIRERATAELSILYRYQQFVDEPNILQRFCKPRTNTSLIFNI